MNLPHLNNILEQFFISFVAGVCSALFVLWVIRPEFKKYLDPQLYKSLMKKLDWTTLLFIIFITVMTILILTGKYELRDDLIVYDEEGNEYIIDGFHPERGRTPTGNKRGPVMGTFESILSNPNDKTTLDEIVKPKWPNSYEGTTNPFKK